MNTAANYIDFASPAPASSTLPSSAPAADAAAPVTIAAAPTATDVLAIETVPTLATGCARSAQLGWVLSSALHVAGAAALVALAIYGPELPSLGGRTSSKPISLTVETPQTAHTEPAPTEFTAATAAAPSPMQPETEPVEKRDPSQVIDDTHRRYVYHEAPVASSPPMMSRDDAEPTEIAIASQANNGQESARPTKQAARPPAFASAAQPPALRITQHASPHDNPLPVHPPEALARGLSGKVVLRLHIDAAGRVQTAEVHRSSGHAILDRAAAATALERWRFHPARAGSRPVAQTIRVPVVFL